MHLLTLPEVHTKEICMSVKTKSQPFNLPPLNRRFSVFHYCTVSLWTIYTRLSVAPPIMLPLWKHSRARASEIAGGRIRMPSHHCNGSPRSNRKQPQLQLSTAKEKFGMLGAIPQLNAAGLLCWALTHLRESIWGQAKPSTARFRFRGFCSFGKLSEKLILLE